MTIGPHKFVFENVVGYDWDYANQRLLIGMKDKTIIHVTEGELRAQGLENPSQTWRHFWRALEHKVPTSITFFSNGTACVGNKFDKQIGELQIGNHRDTINALKEVGVDWTDLDVAGSPIL